MEKSEQRSVPLVHDNNLFIKSTEVFMCLKNKTISELQAEEKSTIETLKVEKQNLQIIRNMKSNLTKKARTKQLCDHGRLLEKYFSPEDFSDNQIEMVLIGLLQNPKNQKAIEILKGGGHISW